MGESGIIMDNTRSYLSRFSGLGLFILALLVVGALVWLTVRSADDNTATNGADEQTTQQDEPTDATPFDENDTTDERTDDESVVDEDENADQDDTGAVAGGQDENGDTDGTLPNTGPESVVASAALLSLFTWLVLNYRQSAVALKHTQK